jgi:hypothetical protein
MSPEHARPGEDHEPELEEALPPEPVAERSHREQQPGEDHDVGVDDPLQGGGGGTELPLQRRDRDVDDRVIDDDDQQAHREHYQGPPATPVDVVSRRSETCVHR